MLRALKALQDKIRALELERSAAAEKFRHLDAEAERHSRGFTVDSGVQMETPLMTVSTHTTPQTHVASFSPTADGEGLDYTCIYLYCHTYIHLHVHMYVHPYLPCPGTSGPKGVHKWEMSISQKHTCSHISAHTCAWALNRDRWLGGQQRNSHRWRLTLMVHSYFCSQTRAKFVLELSLVYMLPTRVHVRGLQ